MFAIPNTRARRNQFSAQPRAESGKPVNSISFLRPLSLRRTGMFALPKESEDACLTGGTRSLDRRLLALNLKRSHASMPAIQLRIAGFDAA